MSIARHHADWLNLVPNSGPFVSLPVMMRTFPQGLEPRDPVQAKLLREAYEEWNDDPTVPGRHRAWVLYVLTNVLGYPQNQITEGQSLPAGLEAYVAVQGETLRPDIALVGPTGSDTAGKAQLLITIYPSEQSLERPVAGKHWKATPATRMMELLHAADVPLGLVTNGEQWMLVYAPRGETTGYASWYASLWMDEHITLRAFHSLLGVRRFFGVAADSTLCALLRESAQDQQEVTDQLGYQVREAVEVLVQSFDALDRENNRTLLEEVSETELYNAALTVMMRLVFLFSAEERGLLYLGKPLYDDNYAVSTLQEQLQETADRHGEEVLERRFDAWARLLATFRAVHGGIRHQDLLLPAYGGSLFDPDRYPFLEGRPAGSSWQTVPAEPLAVNNRVALHLLSALQRLQVKVPGGGPAESRRISFSALGVEQIGHVYEGLLDHTAVRAEELVLGIQGTRKREPEIAVSTLEALLTKGQDALIAYLKEETGRSVAALRKLLDSDAPLEEHRLLIACGHDESLVAQLRPFAGIIREDSFGRPLVVLPGSVYVTAGSDRRSTGTHYTPPSLTEPIVQHTLEPLVYEGPAEGKPREQWQLKPPTDILALKVCDMAMGSGAFLVQTCRYLSERLVEAWENVEKNHPDGVLITPEGEFSSGMPGERIIPADPAERLAIARRYVADRCLYGVDINPMAVEMAKLSLWLITLDKNRAFTFLDHALKCGDSLLGLWDVEQVFKFHLDASVPVQTSLWGDHVRGIFEYAMAKRRELESFTVVDVRDAEAKARLLAEADRAMEVVRILCDLLIAGAINTADGNSQRRGSMLPDAFDQYRNRIFDRLMEANSSTEVASAIEAVHSLIPEGRLTLNSGNPNPNSPRNPFHWPLEFPEIFDPSYKPLSFGFSAFVGNPPFMGGSKIANMLGGDYRNLISSYLANGLKGKADLCTYFFLRATNVLKEHGSFGLMATNSISQGDNRTVGIEQLLTKSIIITRAKPNLNWPGAAGVTIGEIWGFRGKWSGTYILDEQEVEGISSFLAPLNEIKSDPMRLAANVEIAFRGTEIKGLGFTLEPNEATRLIQNDPKNKDVLLPYITGEDLNSRPDQSPSRMVINFQEWSREKAQQYQQCFQIVTEKVKPYRDTIIKQIHEPDYWKFWDKRIDSYARIKNFDRVLVRSLIANRHCMAFLPTGIIFSHKVLVFGFSDYASFALLQSSIHEEWARVFCGAALRRDMSYSTKNGFETFPFPNCLGNLIEIGEDYHQRRKEIMLARLEGMTSTYNRFHNPDETTDDIQCLRELHIKMDRAVADVYGWTDLDLGHDFHETKQGIRFTVSEPARREILDRLLALNHERYKEEVAQGLHDKGRPKTKKPPKPKSPRKKKSGDQQELF